MVRLVEVNVENAVVVDKTTEARENLDFCIWVV